MFEKEAHTYPEKHDFYDTIIYKVFFFDKYKRNILLFIIKVESRKCKRFK